MKYSRDALKKRFAAFKDKTLYPVLAPASKKFVRRICQHYPLTFQELRMMTEMARDLEMWREETLEARWERLEKKVSAALTGGPRKERLFRELSLEMSVLKKTPRIYSGPAPSGRRKKILKPGTEKSERKIFGACPVASPKTVCCQLKTIDAVQNCVFGCSYCTIQTFYGDRVIFDGRVREKLGALRLDPARFYHVGTGQSSDSLVWGNRGGLLDALCEFAAAHPNLLLELKTKSSNVSYFLDHEVPPNVMCSWTLNTDAVITHEERGTACLDVRLAAARKAADRGVRVGFHFHPLVDYRGWDAEYPEVARRVLQMFRPEEVLFVSYGSVTFIKPVIQKIRERGAPSKILQMEMVRDPHGKWTYPPEIKLKLFRKMEEAFKPWHDKVYRYLCMETAFYWDAVFGWHYPTNDAFEADFGIKTLSKIAPHHNPIC